MAVLSAGIVLYHFNDKQEPEVLLVHPGGPFWKNKDEGAWSIPKGEYEVGEDPLTAAKREFQEETGSALPEAGYTPLQPVKMKSGKTISAWAINTWFDVDTFSSNLFEIEWPPKSGKKQKFPEVDKAQFFSLPEAKTRINSSQQNFIVQLETILKG